MGYVARLRKGGRTLDLSQPPYALADSFNPPSVAEEPVIGRTSSMNPYGGSRPTGVNANSQAFALGVDIFGSSIAELDDAFDELKAMLTEAGDEGEPLYFDWIPQTNVSVEPLFGQWNAARSAEVTWGHTHKPPEYTSHRGALFLEECPVDLLIDPYPLGAEQLVGRASGNVWEDWYGSSRHRSWGVGVCGAGANKFTNPVYGHATWDNNWLQSDASLFVEKCTRKDLVLFGKVSAYVSNHRALTFTHYQSLTLTVASYVISFFAKKSNKSAVTSSDVQAYYNASALTTTFYSLGNGWYWCVSASFTGAASALATGILVKANKSFVVDGFKCEQSAYATPFGYGDMPGWTWDGTAHDSASTRTAGKLTYDWQSIIDGGVGSLTIIWTPTFSSSEISSGSYYLFASSGADWKLYWDASATCFKFNVGAFTASSASTSFTANVPIVIHLVWGSSGTMQIYINGSASGSPATYGLNKGAIGTLLYIGSDTSAANHAYGVFSALTTCRLEMTATEVSNDYINMTPLVSARKRVDYMPWQWHWDGTNWDVNSASDTDYSNFTIVGGVPGSVEAITRMRIKHSSNFATTDAAGLWMSRMLVPLDVQLADLADFYGELSGTTDGTSSGGAYETIANLTTTATAFTNAISLENEMMDILSGQEIGLLYRMKDALGTGLQARFYYQFGADATFYSKWQNVESKDAFLARVTSFLGFKDVRRNIEGMVLTYPAGSGFLLQMKRSSDTGDVSCDYYQVVTKPTLRIFSTTTATTSTRVLYDSKTHDVIAIKSTDELSTDLIYVEGDVFELAPDCLNFITSVAGDIKRETQAALAASDSLTFERVTVQPRWALQ